LVFKKAETTAFAKKQIMQTREPTQDLNLKKQTSVISLQGKWPCLFFFFKHSANHSNNSKEFSAKIHHQRELKQTVTEKHFKISI